MGTTSSKEEEKKNANLKTKADMADKDKSILQLKIARDKLIKFQKQNDKDAKIYIEKAKLLLKQGQKKRALIFMRLKKYKDKQAHQIDAQLLNLQQLVSDVEFASHQVEVVNGLKAGNEALKALNKLMPIDEVEKIMEESSEAIAYQEEVSAVLNQGLSSDDDAEVLEELAALDLEDVNDLPEVPNLPEVPTTKVEVDTQKEETATEEKEAIAA